MSDNPQYDRWQVEVLSQLSAAGRYLDWQLSWFAPSWGKNILELGCGIGIVTEKLLACGARVTAVDNSQLALDELKRRVGVKAGVNERLRLLCGDLADDSFWSNHRDTYDTIVAINIVEHVKDDLGLCRTLARRLEPGGRLQILVPAEPMLYGSADRTAGHVRRYRRRDALELIERSSLTVSLCRSFNIIGAIGWWLRFVIRREEVFSSGEIGLMDRLTPCLRAVERIVPVPFGLSVVAEGILTTSSNRSGSGHP